LQVHHIDSSIVLEPQNTENGRICRKYIQLLGYKYLGKFSVPMMGELFLYLVRKIESGYKRYEFLDGILDLVASKEVEIFGVDNTERIFMEIKENLPQLDPMDSLLLACASVDNGVFVTLDKKLLRSRELIREKFFSEVMHPKEFLSF
jgi:predicted nucleic acid-binding protein